jgi:hypothetical protein
MQSDRSSKRLWGCLGCGGCLLVVLALIVLVPAIVFFTWSRRASREAEAELAQIRAAGEPTTPDELKSFYPIAPAEQAAARRWAIGVQSLEGQAFQAAAEKLPIVGLGEDEIPPPGQPWPDLQAAEKLLQQYAASLEQLHAAAESGSPARYTADFAPGLNMPLDHIQPLRAGVRLLVLEAHVRAHRGDARGAARSIHTIFMLADSLRQEPIIISQLIRYAFDGIAEDLFERLLPAVDFADEDLDRLQGDLRAIDYSDGVHRAMIGERVMGIMAIRDPASMDPSGQFAAPGWRLFRDANLANYLKQMNRLVAAAKPPWPEARRDTAEICGDLRAAASGGSSLTNAEHAIMAVVLPGVGGFLYGAVRSTASSRATDAVVAVERLRRENGRLPQRLQELVPKFLPDIPIDPFDGRPLRYTVQGGRYVVYSVGRDGVDNGGQGDAAGEPDLVFPVQRRLTQQETNP